MIQDIFEEAKQAARGVWGLIVGDRNAPSHFNFGQDGLITSFLALLVVLALQLLVQVASGLGAFESALMAVLIYASVLGVSVVFLRQQGRSDALVPFIVTTNWFNAAVSLGSLALVLSGLMMLLSGLVVIALLVLELVVFINIGRIILTFKASQIVLLLIVQFVGVMLALIVMFMILPPPPEELAALQQQLSSQL